MPRKPRTKKAEKERVDEVEPVGDDPRTNREPPAARVHVAPGKKALAVDWDVIEQEYIGGFIAKDSKGKYERRWPTFRDLEERHGIAASTINYQSTRRNWVERRAEFQKELQKNFDAVLAKSRGTRLDEAAKMLDTFVAKFAAAIKKDAIPRASIADLERALKLQQWIASEQKAATTGAAAVGLSELQRRHREVVRFVEALDPAECGVIPGRTERDEAAERERSGATKGDTPSQAGPAPSRTRPEPGTFEPPEIIPRRPPSNPSRPGGDRRSAWHRVGLLAEAAIASNEGEGEGERPRAA